MYDFNEYAYQSAGASHNTAEDNRLLVNANAEMSIIGSCFINPDAPREIVKAIPDFNWTCFALPSCQQLYMVIEDLDRRGQPINNLTVMDRGYELGIEVDTVYLTECTLSTPTALYVINHAEIVYRDHQKRRSARRHHGFHQHGRTRNRH